MPTTELEPKMSATVEVEEDKDAATGASTKVAVAMREKDDQELLDHIAGFGMDKGYEVRVYRTSPKKWKGISIEGHLNTFEEWMNEEELKALYGGGTLQLKIHRPDSKGRMQYLKTTSIKLPGPPHGEGIEDDEPSVVDMGPSEESGNVATHAMDTLKDVIGDLRENKPSGGMDPVMLGLIMDPLKAQIEASNASLAALQQSMVDKDAKIMDLIAAKPDTGEKDVLLNKMFDTESGRSEHLRGMHESEMRQLRENTKEDVRRSEERHRDELRAREDIQKREIDNMTRSNETQISTLKMSYDSRIESLKSDVTRVERDLSEARTELIALRAKKDKTVIEQTSELVMMKEALDGLGFGGNKDEDDRKWWEKAIGQLTENPEGVGQLVGMMTGQGNPAHQQQAAPPQQQQQIAPPQQQAQPQAPAQEEAPVYNSVDDIPPGVPFKDQDDNILMKMPDGSIVPYEHGVKIAEAAAAANGEEVLQKPEPSEVKMAIAYMESAFSAGTDAATFTTGARSLIPGGILKYMEAVGVDTFLSEVAVLEQNSPLRNHAGRTFMRDVAKFLLEGVPG